MKPLIAFGLYVVLIVSGALVLALTGSHDAAEAMVGVGIAFGAILGLLTLVMVDDD